MGEKFWFSAPSAPNKPDWTGLVERSDRAGAPYKISLIRNTKDNQDLLEAQRRRAHFPDGYVNGYLNMRKKGSLLQCRQTAFNDLETLQVGCERKALTFHGEAAFLLEGAWVETSGSYYKSFTGSFQGLEAILRHKFNLSIDPLREESVFSYCSTHGHEIHCFETGAWSSSPQKRTTTRELNIKVIFDMPFNVYPLMHIYRAFCQMFDVLSGKAYKPRPAYLSTTEERIPSSPSIKYASHYYTDTETATSVFCELNSSEVLTALERLLSQESSHLVADLAVIYRLQFEPGFLEEKLFWSIPILEQQLRRNFQSDDGNSFIELRGRFFEKIETEFDEDLIMFSRKHLRVNNHKPKGLKQFVSDAVALFQKYNYPIPDVFAEAFYETRNGLMHGALDESKIKLPLNCVERTTRFLCIAMFLNELGVPISKMNGLGRSFFPS